MATTMFNARVSRRSRRRPPGLALLAVAALAHIQPHAQPVIVPPLAGARVGAASGVPDTGSQTLDNNDPVTWNAGMAVSPPFSSTATASSGATSPQSPDTRQRTIFQPSIDVRAVATDNSGLTTDAARRSDLIGSLEGDLRVRARGARLAVTGDVGAEFISYANRTQADRVLPRGRLDLDATLVDRAFFLNAGVEASRTRADPLGPQLDSASTANTLSTVSWRASPYFLHQFSSSLSAIARSDTVITQGSGDNSAAATASGSTLQRELVRIERQPVPLGWSLEASREDTQYQDSTSNGLLLESVRATVSMAAGQEWLWGVIGGREHSVFGVSDETNNRYGLLTRWRPSVRTQLDAEVEHRFFGTSWDVRFRHRMPRSVVDFSLQRAPSATPTLGLGEAQTDPGALLDSLLSSRIPNEGERGEAIDQLITTRGLASNFSQPVQIFADSAQLAQRADLSLILNGVRNTVLGSVYFVKAQALNGTLPTLTATSFDSRQWGGSIGFFRRLARDTSGAIELSWNAVDALGARTGDNSRQVVGTFSLSRRLNPTTTFSAGLRRLSSRVNLQSSATTTQVDETQVFAGLRMQY